MRKSAPRSYFFSPRILIGLVLFSLGVLSALLGLGTPASVLANTNNQNPDTLAVSKPSSGEHVARGAVGPPDSQRSGENVAQSEVALSSTVMAPTRSSFIANWNRFSGASGYRLDVSTSSSFSSYVSGYQDLDVGNINSRVVSGLSPDTTYYYRVRAYNAVGISGDANVMTATTTSGAGLIINATFDTSITNKPNAAAIEAMINQAIAIYESLFSDPVTVSILFRYSTTQPNGAPLGTGIAQSTFVIYPIPWNTYISALEADAKTGSDTTANATLPANPLSTNI